MHDRDFGILRAGDRNGVFPVFCCLPETRHGITFLTLAFAFSGSYRHVTAKSICVEPSQHASVVSA